MPDDEIVEKVAEPVGTPKDETSITSLDDVLSVLNTVLSKIEVIENHLSTPDEPDELIEDIVEEDFTEDLDKIF